MTTDQFLTLLAICVWPIVALIAGVAFVHGVRLLVDGLFIAASKVSRDTLGVASSVLQDTLPALIRALVVDPKPSGRDEVAATAERCLIALIQSTGGIPARQRDDAVRSLVREIRKMYKEVAFPTPEPPEQEPQPEPVDVSPHDFDIGDMGDLEDVEEGEVYGS